MEVTLAAVDEILSAAVVPRVEAALAGAAEAVPMAAAAAAGEAPLVAAALSAAAGEDAALEDAAVAAEVAEDADRRRQKERSTVPYGGGS